MSSVATILIALVCLDVSLMPRRHLIESVTSIRLLFSWYTDKKFSVLWNKTLLVDFSVSNGVRQGSILSPILFIVYIDELLTRLESQAVGRYWSHYFIGALGYVDAHYLLSICQ